MRTCRICRDKYQPVRSVQPTCGAFDCMVAYAEMVAEKSAKRRAKEERAEDNVKREAMKRKSELKGEAQAAINAYRRYQDILAGHWCICCGKPFEPDRPGGSIDAGHYLSRGSHPNLSFVEMNINAQRKSCNRPGGTTAASFRDGMVRRYGLAAVEELEADKAPRNYRADDYRLIRDEYRAKLRELKKKVSSRPENENSPASQPRLYGQDPGY